MLELAPVPGAEKHFAMGVAGDSYNTAVYLARAGLAVNYLTRLGDDQLSTFVLEQLVQNAIGTQHIRQVSGRSPGLYLIDNDDRGERQFSYWRDNSPARECFDQPVVLADCGAFYFTGISLAVWHDSLDHLLALLTQLHDQGRQIIFDPNYRANLWRDNSQARKHYQAVLPFCQTVLPTLDDETALWGVDSIAECRHLYQDYGAEEIVIKGHQLTCHAFCGSDYIRMQAQAVEAIDTTGAGDSFNGGYLAARLKGDDMATAIDYGQRLSAAVVQYRGAILPANQQADYEQS
jgi:2-dehydro-3-deoxygluconokinase